MSHRYTVEASGLRHGVRSEIQARAVQLGSGIRCHTECGGYVDQVVPDDTFLVITCVRCLGVAQILLLRGGI